MIGIAGNLPPGSVTRLRHSARLHPSTTETARNTGIAQK